MAPGLSIPKGEAKAESEHSTFNSGRSRAGIERRIGAKRQAGAAWGVSGEIRFNLCNPCLDFAACLPLCGNLNPPSLHLGGRGVENEGRAALRQGFGEPGDERPFVSFYSTLDVEC